LDLALLAVKAGCGTPRPDGFLHSCLESLRGKKPLPATRTRDEEDVHECIDAVVKGINGACSVRLHHLLNEEKLFPQPAAPAAAPGRNKAKDKVKDKVDKLPSLELVYLPGVKEVHTLQQQRLDIEVLQKISKNVSSTLKEAKEEFGTASATPPSVPNGKSIGFHAATAVVIIQIGYCVSDVISKCAVGVLIYQITYAKSNKEGLLSQ